MQLWTIKNGVWQLRVHSLWQAPQEFHSLCAQNDAVTANALVYKIIIH